MIPVLEDSTKKTEALMKTIEQKLPGVTKMKNNVGKEAAIVQVDADACAAMKKKSHTCTKRAHTHAAQKKQTHRKNAQKKHTYTRAHNVKKAGTTKKKKHKKTHTYVHNE